MISNRLKSLTKYIDKNDSLIDIGCDHALLDIYLVKNNILDKVIVSDINKNALEGGIKNIKREGITSISARLGSGLEVLNEFDNINTVLISGMGTSTIIKILSNDYVKKINKLIIQSNNDHFELRTFITKLGFSIDKEEYLVDNKKNYINIVFVRGKSKYNKQELKYGPILIKNKEYLEFELNNCLKIKKLIVNANFTTKYKLNKEIKYINKLIRKIPK